MQTLEARVGTLEQSLRRWRRSAWALAALAFGWPLLAFAQNVAAPATEITCRKLIVVDEAGKTVGEWAATGPGLSKLAVRDGAGKERIALGVDLDDTSMVVRDSQSQKRLGWAVDGMDMPHFVVSDKFSRPRIHMAVNETGVPTILLRSADGAAPAGIGLTQDGTGWLLPNNPGQAGARPKAGSVDAKVPPETPASDKGNDKGDKGK